MRKKELLNLIKTKAAEVEIKDLSQSILEKVRLLPQEQPVIQEPIQRRRLSFKPIYLSALSIATAVFAFLLIYSPSAPLPTISDVNSVMAFSAVSASSIAEYSIDLLSNEDSVSLSSGYFALDTSDTPLIDGELDTISTYLGMMERILNSDGNFDYTFSASGSNGYQYQLTFTTKDLMDVESTYTLMYNRVDDQENHIYTINGVLNFGDMTYMISGSSDITDPHLFQFRIAVDQNNYIDVNYEIDDAVNRYQLSITENAVTVQAVNLEVKEMNQVRTVMMDFVQGNATGSYSFQIENVDSVRTMRIAYYIYNQISETGKIDVTVSQSGTETTYVITVTPKGRTPFVITPSRGRPSNAGHPGGYGNQSL